MKRKCLICWSTSVGLALVVTSATARGATNVVATASQAQSFLGGRTGKLVYVDKNDGDKCYWIDLSDMSVHKLSDDSPVREPLISPDGTRVVYSVCDIVDWSDASKNSGDSYVRPLSGSPRTQVGGMSVDGKHAFCPHWWVEPGSGDEYIVYMDACEKDQQTSGGRATWKQEINASNDPDGSPVKILDHAFDGGLSEDGKWIGEAYFYCHMAQTMDLGGGDGWAMTSRLDGGAQCCNASVSPDNNYYIMYLDIGHDKCEIRTSSDALIKEVWKPSGAGEMQNPEYSTHPGYSTFTAEFSGSYYLYIANTSTGANLKIAEGDFLVPHLWVDPSSGNDPGPFGGSFLGGGCAAGADRGGALPSFFLCLALLLAPFAGRERAKESRCRA